jgi:predicted DNA-binding protein (MmcQ/YjbR family)
MTFNEMDTYLLSKKGATYDYPFDETTRVYRVAGKIFALTADKDIAKFTKEHNEFLKELKLDLLP